MLETAWVTEFGGVVNGYFRRNNYVTIDDSFDKKRESFVTLCHNKDVYQCAYCYNDVNDIDHSELYGNPYLDFDVAHINDDEEWSLLISEVKFVANYIESAMNIPAEALKIYFSGHKGFHMIIPAEILGIKPSKKLNDQFKYFAMGLAYIRNGKNATLAAKDILDLRIYDRKRLLRLPNSVNAKSGRYKVPVTIDQIYDYNYAQFLEWASEPRELSSDSYNETEKYGFKPSAREGYIHIIENGTDFEDSMNGGRRRHTGHRHTHIPGEIEPLLPCTLKLLEDGAAQGIRNHSCFALASSLFQAGYDMDDVTEMVETWNDEKCDPSLSDREVQITINSAAKSFEEGKIVGCGKYKDLGYCVNTCKLLN